MKPSAFSKLSSAFREIVDVPEEERRREREAEEKRDERVEEQAEQPEAREEPREPEEEPTREQDDARREEIVRMLSRAAEEWKQTGDTDFHIEAPKEDSFGKKMAKWWGALRHRAPERETAGLRESLDNDWERIMETVREVKRLKGKDVDREEIEKLYKQLSRRKRNG